MNKLTTEEGSCNFLMTVQKIPYLVKNERSLGPIESSLAITYSNFNLLDHSTLLKTKLMTSIQYFSTYFWLN